MLSSITISFFVPVIAIIFLVVIAILLLSNRKNKVKSNVLNEYQKIDKMLAMGKISEEEADELKNAIPNSSDFLTQSPEPLYAKGLNGSAIASLVLGIVGIFGVILFPLGILAIIFGLLGLKKAKQLHTGNGMAIAGLILGCIPIVLSILLLPTLMPVLTDARMAAKNASSMANMKNIGLSIMAYETAHGMYPDKVGRIVGCELGQISIDSFTNPKSDRNAIYYGDAEVITDGYAFIMPKKNTPKTDIMGYESKKYMWHGKVAVLYVSGMVEQLPFEKLRDKLTIQEKQ